MTADVEPLAPGVRRLGALMKRQPSSSIAKMSDAELAKAGAFRKAGPIVRMLLGWPRRGVRKEDRTIPGRGGAIPIRIYRPARASVTPRPLVVVFHGGGWALGSLDMADWPCSTVAADLGAIVVSVDYRLAPTHRFPAAVEDCYDALVWSGLNAAALGASGKLGVMGESAGGNLAAVACLFARDQGGPEVHHQALIYPVTDLAGDTASRRLHAEGIILTAADMSRFAELYLGDKQDRDDWRLSPLRAASHRGLPAALIQVAGHDPLHDEGVAYAEALRRDGVPVVLADYPAMPHGFLNFPYVSRDAKPAIRQIVVEQRKFLIAG